MMAIMQTMIMVTIEMIDDDDHDDYVDDDNDDSYDDEND